MVEPDRPTPAGAATPGEFVAALRSLKAWSGLSYRRLERQAQGNGDVLPRSTITQALSHDRLPQEDLVAAFVRACGCGPAETDEWIRTRRRIAAGAVVAVPATPSAPPPELEPAPPVYVPVILGRPRRTVLASFAAATAIGTAAGALIVAVLKSTADSPAKAAPPTATAQAANPSAEPTDVPAIARSRHPGADAVAKVLPPSGLQLRRPAAAPKGVPTALYVGDKTGVETRAMVEYFVHTTGKARVVSAVHAGTTLCDLARGGELPQLIARTKPGVVAVQVWGTPGCKGGVDDARRTVRQIAQAAARAKIPRPKVVWVLQQPDPAAPRRIYTLNQDVYQRIADENPGDTTADAGRWVSEAAGYQPKPGSRYAWTGAVPCDPLERARKPYCGMPKVFGGVTAIHPEPESVQLTLPGAARYGREIARAVLTALGR